MTDASTIADILAKVPTGLLINGQWRDASDGATFDVENPATEEHLATLASATSEDAVLNSMHSSTAMSRFQ